MEPPQRRTIEELEAYLERNKQELMEFARIATHDLKSPLANIQALGMMLKRQYGEVLGEEGGYLLDLLIDANRRAINQLNDMRNYSRIFELPTKKEEVELSSFLQNIISSLTPPLEFRFIYPSEPIHIVIAPAILQQILYQLLSNAIRHNKKETGRVEIKFSDTPSFYSFSVSDNGSGIPIDQQPKIFVFFQTLGGKDRFGNTGSGLGLCIVKRLVEQCGGVVTVTSEVGEGSTFEFTLPK